MDEEVVADLNRFARAMLAHEHAGGKAVFCFNFGNITSSAARTGDYFLLEAREFIDSKWVLKTQRYRAWPSAQEGLDDFFDLLHRRYPDVLWWAFLNEPAKAVEALKAGGYFTAPLELYLAGVMRYYVAS